MATYLFFTFTVVSTFFISILELISGCIEFTIYEFCFISFFLFPSQCNRINCRAKCFCHFEWHRIGIEICHRPKRNQGNMTKNLNFLHSISQFFFHLLSFYIHGSMYSIHPILHTFFTQSKTIFNIFFSFRTHSIHLTPAFCADFLSIFFFFFFFVCRRNTLRQTHLYWSTHVWIKRRTHVLNSY